MQLGIRFLNDVNTVNSFETTTSFKFNAGSADTVYFQLVDSSLDTIMSGINPPGRRYIPAASSQLVVQIQNLDDAKKIVRTATQPFSGDGSIWAFPVLATDPISGTVALSIVLTEPTRVLRTQVNVGMLAC